MKIAVQRLEAHRYATTIERDDGVHVSATGYGFMRPLPHDLAHYVVESSLHLRRGFWGSVASGAKFRGMTVVTGRQKPHAEERAKEVERQNTRHLSAAEKMVGCFESILAASLDQTPAIAVARLRTMMGSLIYRPINSAEINLVCQQWRDMRARWDALPVGQAIELRWKAR